ncbi:hypothetical protein D3C78_1744910 [compost metagenome]
MEQLGSGRRECRRIRQPRAPQLFEAGRKLVLVAFVAHDQAPFQIPDENRVGNGIHQGPLEHQLVLEDRLGLEALVDLYLQATVP